MSFDKKQRVVAVAGMDGSDMALHRLVKEVLQEHGIWSSCEGSVGYDVLVYEKDSKTAIEILTLDSKLTGKGVECFPRPVVR